MSLVCLFIAQALSMPNVGTGQSSVTTFDGASIYWNPALFSEAERPELLLDGNMLIGDVRYNRERRGAYQNEDSLEFKLPVSALDPTKTGWSRQVVTNPAAPLPSLFASYPFRLPDLIGSPSRLAVGLGFYAPYAAALTFPSDGAQRFALQQALIATLHATAAASFRLGDIFSVGAGVSYVMGYAELQKVEDFAILPELGQALANPPISQANDFGQNAPVGVRELAVMARPIQLRNMVAHSVTFNAGISVRPIKRLLLGLGYQHGAPMRFLGDFAIDMNDDFFTRDLASQGLRFVPIVRGRAQLEFPLPRSFHFGAAVTALPNLVLHVNAAYTMWSQVQNFDVTVTSPDLAQPQIGIPDTARFALVRRWVDTIAVDALVRYSPAPKWWLWAVAGYRSPAVPDTTIDVASPDGHRVVAGVGGSYSPIERLALLAELKTQSILPRTVVASDNDRGNGLYRLTLIVIGVHARVTL